MAEQAGGTERLATFTDGVLAISMTLLALDVRLPIDVSQLDNAALWQAMLAVWPRLFSYALSFIVVGSFWINHKNRLGAITAADGIFTWLNIIFLLLVGLVPFATALLADSGNAVATASYAAVMAACSGMLSLMALYARRSGLMPGDRAPGGERFGLAAIVFLLSIPVAFYDADFGKYFWLLLFPLGAASRWAGVRRPRS
ncbi:MAG TPA: TMEM175 family protein [Devosia sp.]|nr:TMEM175 family protein [Devosia sp.]